jgi:hypothetical protein
MRHLRIAGAAWVVRGRNNRALEYSIQTTRLLNSVSSPRGRYGDIATLRGVVKTWAKSSSRVTLGELKDLYESVYDHGASLKAEDLALLTHHLAKITIEGSGEERPSSGLHTNAWRECLAPLATQQLHTFEPVHLVTFVQGLFQARVSDADLLTAVNDTICEKLVSFDPKSLCSVLHMLATLRRLSSPLLRDSEQYVAENQKSFSAMDLCIITNVYSSYGSRVQQLTFKAIEESAVMQFETFSTQELSHLTQSMLEANYRCSELAKLVDTLDSRSVSDSEVPYFCKLLLSVTKSGHRPRSDFVDSVTLRVLAWDTSSRQTSRANYGIEIGRLLRVHATLGLRHSALLKVAQGFVSSDLHNASASPQLIADFVWSFAKLDVPAKKFYKQAAQLLPHLLKQMNCTDIKDFGWAYSKVGNPHPEVFDVLGEHIAAKLLSFRGTALPDMLWGFGKSKHRAPDLFKAVDAHLKNLKYEPLTQLTALQLSILMWSFGRTSFGRCKELSNAVALEAMTRFNTFRAKELTFLLVGCSMTGFKNGAFYSMADHQAARIYRELTNEQINSLRSSFDRVGLNCEQLDKLIGLDV